MKRNSYRIAIIAAGLAAAALAQADAFVYTGGSLQTTFSDYGPNLTIYTDNYFYNDSTFDYGGQPSYGVYSNTPSNSFFSDYGSDSVMETASGNAFTSWLGLEETVYEVVNQSNYAEQFTVSAEAYAFGDDGVTNPESWAVYNTFSGLSEDFGGGTWLAYAGVANTYGWSDQYDSEQQTFTIAPDSYLDFVGYTEYEAVSSSQASAVPGPLAAAPFGVGLIGLMRRRRSARA